MGEKSPESPKKLGKDYQESSNSGCETDDYEDELLQKRQMTMGDDTKSGIKQKEKSKLRPSERVPSIEELKKLGSSPDSDRLEGNQHFGTRKQNLRRGRKVLPPPGLSDDDFADLDY